MYRDDSSSFVRKKNLSAKTESLDGKFVYDNHKGRMFIEWHLNDDKIVIDKIHFPFHTDGQGDL